ncbi:MULTISPECIES: IS110 family transposase [Gordonibacter]|uniref:IS110 family transposase n=1 Tax=Gordonibacter faecis TaxID=3047475 RepID=A0ABT7DQQ4_9ACTN|nr:IS110 family transposase [Gordonibacter sp. KGMB12511]MDJ1651882.1 IS110 family transposase [Gordonibacter sp. KGMB12511]
MEEVSGIFAGVDTHKDVHVLCVLDPLGRKIFEESFTADRSGYDALAQALGDPKKCAVVAIEGTASYGSGLTKRLTELGFKVVEVLRPKRDKRRRGENKNDFADAERAARDAMANKSTSTPKSQSGWVEAVRFLLAARRTCIKTSTACANSAQALLESAPEPIRETYRRLKTTHLMTNLAEVEVTTHDALTASVLSSLQILSLTWIDAKRRAQQAEAAIEALIREHAPALLDMYGCGAISAAELAVCAGDNPERLKSEASFAALCGVSPVEASSGKIKRYRLNRGGNRQANCALHRIALSRLKGDERTKAYAKRRACGQKTLRDITRCLKRYLAREVYHALLHPFEVRKKKGPALREMRLALGLTQTAVAKLLEVPSARISEIERCARNLPDLEQRYGELLRSMA